MPHTDFNKSLAISQFAPGDTLARIMQEVKGIVFFFILGLIGIVIGPSPSGDTSGQNLLNVHLPIPDVGSSRVY